MVKVAHVASVSGSLRYLLLNQMQSMRESGYEVVGISAPGPSVPVLKEAGIRHIAVPLTRRMTPLADLQALFQLYRIMRHERFIIVHGHTPKAELLGQLAARLAGVPIVVDTFRGIYYRPDMNPLWRWLFLRMAKIAASCANVILCQSRETMEMAVREHICPPEKVRYLGNGIDLERFDPQRVDPAAIQRKRLELGLPQGVPVVGFVGRLVAEKGVLDLLRAVPLVRKHVPEVRFVFVGAIDQDKDDAIDPATIAAYKQSSGCIFAGAHTEMPEIYSLMDVFALPSYRESMPRSPMEAAAMHIPCVLTDIPGCREVVTAGYNGLLTPPGDAGALADALVTLLSDSGRARQMGVAGRAQALEHFDERVIFARVKAEYARLLQERGLTAPKPATADLVTSRVRA